MNVAELGFKVNVKPLADADKALDKLGATAVDVDKKVDRVADAIDGLGKEAGAAAPQLDRLGKESGEAARDVDKLGTQSGSAARSVDRLGSESRDTGAAIVGMGRAGSGVGAMLGQLAAAAAAAFGAQQALQVAAIADQYGQISARLQNVIGDSMSLAAAQDAVFAVAQRTRSELSATSDLVSGLGRAYVAAGLSSEQAFATSLRLSEAINNALVTSGTSASSAAGLITQLNQALSSGVLRGDEFNSMMEASPRLAQALAAGLEVPIGSLRAMAEAGELTREAVTAALTGAEFDKLAAEAAKMPLTLAQGWQQATSAFQVYVGRVNAETGATASLAAGLGFVADNMDRLIDSTIQLGSALAAGLGARALIPVLGAMAAQLTVVGSAALGTAGAFTALNLAVAASLAGILAAVAGWQIGTFLRDQFVQVEVAGVGMVTGLARAYEYLRSATEVVTATIAVAFSNTVNGVKRELSGLLSAFADFAQVELPAGLRADFTFGAADAIRKLSADITAGIEPAKSYADAYEEIGKTLRKNLGSVDKMQQDMLDAAIETRKAGQAAAGATIEFNKLGPAATVAATGAGKVADAMNVVGTAGGQVGIGIGNATASLGAFAGATAQAAVSTDEFSDVSQRAAEDSARYWSGAAGAISDAFGDFVASGLRSFSDFGRSLKRIAQQIISDLVSTFAKQRIMIPIMVGAGFSPGAIAGATGMSEAAVASAAGSGGTGMLGGLLGGIGASIGGFSAGLGVAGAAGFTAASSFGLASIAAGNFAVGLGALAGALGPIGLALGGINAITGGRLFGTSYAPTGVQGTQFNFGEGVASGMTFQEESRRRSLFRGRQWRTVESALGEDAQAQIDQFFESVGVAVAQAAGQLGIDIPQRITASFRATTDASGNVISEVGTILGRQYNESFEVFSRRIAAENVIGVLDAALDGEAGRIAEAWRSSADTLADGAQFLLTAATDLRGGFQLLGDASLTGVAELVQRLAGDGESLSAAYARIAGATRLLEEVVALSGVSFDRTREQFIEFAAGIAEAAGGLEEAQRLFRSYFQAFYTEQERGLVALQQARQRAAALAAPIGLDVGSFTGEGGAAAFRALFESQLPTLTAEQAAEYLRFAEALGIVLDLQARYTDAVISTAETIADFMAGVETALAEFAPAQALSAQLEAQRTANAEMIAQATALGASEEQLARVRALGDARIGQIIGSVSQQTAVLTAAMRRLGVAASGTAEDLAVAASTISGDFESLVDEFMGTFYSDAERQALQMAQAAQNLAQALAAAGLATDELISREQLRMQIEAALAAGNASLAESLLRVARAMNEVENSTASATQTLINNANGNQFGGAQGGSGLGFGEVPGGGPGGGLVDDIERIRQGLRDWLQSLTTGDLAPGRPRELLARAQADYQRLLALAQGGDAQALQQLQGASELVLRLGRQVFGSTAGYNALYDQIIREVGGLVGFTPGGAGGNAGTGPVDGLGRSALTAALALDRLSEVLGLSPGSLSSAPTSLPPVVFGGQSDGVVGELRAQREADATEARETQEILRAVRAELAELKAAQRDGVEVARKQTEVMRERR